MVHKFQELEDFDDNVDPAAYRGGYDIVAAYGGVKAADEECAYRRTGNAEDDQEQEVQYGNEKNPYEHGVPGPSICGGRSKPGTVYGGGRDRTAQPDRRKAAYGADSPSHGEDEDSGYRKPGPSHGGEDEDSKPRPSYGYGKEEDSSYRKPRPSYGYVGEEEDSSYRRPRPTYTEEEDSSYSRPRPSYGYGEEDDSSYRRPRPTYTEDEDAGYYRPRPTYTEDEDAGYYRPRPAYTEDSGYRNPYGEEQSSGNWKPYYYGEEVRPSYNGREESSEAYGYGGRRNNDDVDDDTAKFCGGSAYTVVPLSEEVPLPKSTPAKSSWWW